MLKEKTELPEESKKWSVKSVSRLDIEDAVFSQRLWHDQYRMIEKPRWKKRDSTG
jgi:hypothetical protein